MQQKTSSLKFLKIDKSLVKLFKEKMEKIQLPILGIKELTSLQISKILKV